MYGASLRTQLQAVATTPEQFDALLQCKPGNTRRWLDHLVPDRQVARVQAALRQLQHQRQGAA